MERVADAAVTMTKTPILLPHPSPILGALCPCPCSSLADCEWKYDRQVVDTKRKQDLIEELEKKYFDLNENTSIAMNKLGNETKAHSMTKTSFEELQKEANLCREAVLRTEEKLEAFKDLLRTIDNETQLCSEEMDETQDEVTKKEEEVDALRSQIASLQFYAKQAPKIIVVMSISLVLNVLLCLCVLYQRRALKKLYVASKMDMQMSVRMNELSASAADDEENEGIESNV